MGWRGSARHWRRYQDAYLLLAALATPLVVSVHSVVSFDFAVAIPLAWFIPAVVLGGQTYARDVVVKQTVGRAFSTWVHQAPPWFYLERLPLALFPWFFLALASAIALWRTQRWLVNWILAVLVPYSLMSSKLDVYMMALIPSVALLVAEGVRAGVRWGRAANIAAIALVPAPQVATATTLVEQAFADKGFRAPECFAVVASAAAARDT